MFLSLSLCVCVCLGLQAARGSCAAMEQPRVTVDEIIARRKAGEPVESQASDSEGEQDEDEEQHDLDSDEEGSEAQDSQGPFSQGAALHLSFY